MASQTEPVPTTRAAEQFFELDRTIDIEVSAMGRLVAALAEALRICVSLPPGLSGDDIGADRRIIELASAVSVCGLLQAEGPSSGCISTPPELFPRIAQLLNAAADDAEDPRVARALRRDAQHVQHVALGHRDD
ncbi:hypothetical protein GIY30_19195 [Gordonia sp. HNM0687]|uniref:Uncharacterized protein n=1 Tax=Gordonia mangrovi TaxID=2665643 RepID=A0A6L7GTY0_9ACTN|nr:hypothetical protein [Gordonia mangrovi]MXP23469.1 hypothetical protein [Gordonia mangrovi]UVF76635.1 hypothetical protein NWF22_14810 [Gordonia mangrovi]